MLTSWNTCGLEHAHSFFTTVQRPELTFVGQINRAVIKAVTQNRENLFSILSRILFCCSHNIALMGKKSISGNLFDLLRFTTESGVTVVKNHMKVSRKMEDRHQFVYRTSL